MFGYYCKLALHSFRRNRLLTALMVLAIAVGIGASMTTLTVFHVLAADPIPGKSAQLFYVEMNVYPDDKYEPAGEEPLQLTRRDAEALLRDKRGDRQAMMSAGGVNVVPVKAEQTPSHVEARFTSSDFFPMFAVPMRYGHAWTAEDDTRRARVAVLSRKLNEQLFGDVDSTGRDLQVGENMLRVVGVTEDWSMNPRFYDLTNTEYGDSEDIFVPFSTSRDLQMGASGTMECWGSSGDGQDSENAPCTWIQYWVELADAGKRAAYRDYLDGYARQQHDGGRFTHPADVRLSDVMAWLDRNHAVPADVRLQLWLALVFLGICLLNTVGLMLAKFLRQGGEIGVRRALGASRRAIFAQHLVEAAMIGAAGGMAGLLLAWLGLWLVRRQPADYAALAHMDGSMLFVALALTLGSSLLAGALPAWQAMRVQTAMQLKSQ
ncbi:ABC transporter permease [Xanthomonas sp. NCPPB 2654]|uniref:ABC transporter permease n=1 Tax=unclassified Xanthomonas TaxID=2643310 RepID=UPI0021DFE6B1|nr:MULTISPECIES: ABC transporter permease [unclassified Xanthomonas]MDL5368044.1 ABC transporter permease [Xanthomonas sp. NCPPB 2654]UYC21427.1 ABC transporter permease [Xanthomonas sp. CFBP 8443]